MKPKEYEVAEVTPEMAEQMLRHNHPNNRHLRPQVVADYARQMQAGKWEGCNGETIKFDAQGVLIDGQHRLHAVVKAGCPVILEVRRNVDGAMGTVDVGVGRSAADILYMADKTKYAGSIAATARLLILLFGGPREGTRVAPNEIRELVERFPGRFEDAARQGSGISHATGLAPSVAAASSFIMHMVDDEEATAFELNLVSGEGLSSGDARLALRTWLNRTGRDKRFTVNHHGKTRTFSVVAKTWNAWRKGEKTQLVKHLPDEKISSFKGFNPALLWAADAE